MTVVNVIIKINLLTKIIVYFLIILLIIIVITIITIDNIIIIIIVIIIIRKTCLDANFVDGNIVKEKSLSSLGC